MNDKILNDDSPVHPGPEAAARGDWAEWLVMLVYMGAVALGISVALGAVVVIVSSNAIEPTALPAPLALESTRDATAAHAPVEVVVRR